MCDIRELPSPVAYIPSASYVAHYKTVEADSQLVAAPY